MSASGVARREPPNQLGDGERRRPAPQRVGGGAERPQIGARVGVAEQRLGREEAGRAARSAGGAAQRREAEVAEARRAGSVGQKVRRFDVVMHEAAPMQRLERAADLGQ